MTIPQQERLRYLLQQYTRKLCTREEMEELFGYLEHPQNRSALNELVDQEFGELKSGEETGDIDWEFMYQKVLRPAVPVRGVFLRRIAMAASVIVLLSAGAFLWVKQSGRHDQTAQLPSALPANDALPGGNKAILTLADGSAVTLDSSENGLLGQQGNINILKQNGQLSYNKQGAAAGDMVYNKVATPRGGQYQLLLSDGTKVWLNASSSIRFPVAFSQKERRVEITGEVYFEVAKAWEGSARVPFYCTVNNMEVEVLGTHFNINAYQNEAAVKTTLLEGAVNVKAGAVSRRLIPGQQSTLGKDGQMDVAENVKLEEVISWKNGLFVFNEADIQQIMRQVERWYNLDVVYEGAIPTGRFTGKVSRDTKASQMMKVLELSGIHFTIESNKLIIKP